MIKRIMCVTACGLFGGFALVNAWLGWYWWMSWDIVLVLIYTLLSFLYRRQRVINELTKGSWELREGGSKCSG